MTPERILALSNNRTPDRSSGPPKSHELCHKACKHIWPFTRTKSITESKFRVGVVWPVSMPIGRQNDDYLDDNDIKLDSIPYQNDIQVNATVAQPHTTGIGQHAPLSQYVIIAWKRHLLL